MSLLEFSCRLGYPTGFRLDATFATDEPVTALFGPSGGGKTTVLSVLAGLRRPDAGRIRLGKHLLSDSAAGVWLPPQQRRIGYVFQDHLLFPHLSVRDNLLYGWRRRPRDARPLDFRRVAEVLELTDLLGRRPHTLSGGQRQRVALGRALLCCPDLLLLDEPTAALEAELRQRVLDHVAQVVAEWGIPTLYVTHDVREVRRLAGWVVFLERGQVRMAGRPADLLG